MEEVLSLLDVASSVRPEWAVVAASWLAWLVAEPRRWIGLGVGGVGVGAWIHQAIIAARVRSSRAWPAAPGVILSSDACIERTAGEVAGGVRSSAIRYGYEVRGRLYESDVVSLGGDFNTSGGGPAARRLARYPEGMRVVVYYDSRSPSRACLERTLEAPWLVPFVGAVFLVVGALVMTGVWGPG